MQYNIFDLNLNDRAFEAIKSGTKKVEIRANKTGTNVSKMKENDIIIFTKQSNDEKIKCLVEKIKLYSCVRNLLINEGTDRTLSSGKNLEDGIISIESIPGYKEAISVNGVYAITIKYIGSYQL